MMAVFSGKTSCLQLLLNQGARVDDQSDDVSTALISAAISETHIRY